MRPIKTILFCGMLLIGSALSAQSLEAGTVKGIVADSTLQQGLKGATVVVLSSADSSVLSFTLANEDGTFQLNHIVLGHHVLSVSFLGYETIVMPFSLSKEKPAFYAGTLHLIPAAQLLGEVIVRSMPVVINGDTTDFRASHFKTIPNATTEDLLKKLPGIEVEKDGSVKANGETVTRILVDGKRFFGNDPKTATRNLPADIIEKVQLIDAQSEQSEFSGFDDGERVKTINIVTKKDKKKGVFGKGSVAAGNLDRSASALSAHSFSGNRQISFIAQNNNINNQNFSIQDFLGSQNMGGGRGRNAGGSNVFSGNASGISTTSASGINYSDVWSQKTRVNGSYFFNQVKATNNRERYRETFVANDSSMFSANRLRSENTNKNHRFHFEVDHRFDSLNSVLIRPAFSYQNSDGSSETNAVTTKGRLVNLNDVRSVVTSENLGYNFSNSFLFRHRFRKAGRTFSIQLTQSVQTSDRHGANLSLSKKSGSIVDTLDQIHATGREGKAFGANISLTNRVGRRSQMEVAYHYAYNENQSDQQTRRWNNSAGAYDVVISNLTNHFENTTKSQRLGLNYRQQLSPEWSYTAGMAVQYADLASNNLSKATFLDQSFYTIFPSVNFYYRKSRTKSLRFTYRGQTQQPGITQLQDVIDNSNILHIRSGNPGLKQEFTNSWNVQYNTFSTTTQQNLNMSLQGNAVSNRIANTSFINTTRDSVVVDGFKLGPGAQYTKPQNLDGSFQLGGSAHYGFPLKRGQSTMRINTRMNYDRDVNLVNEVLGTTHNYSFGAGIRASVNLKDRLDLNLSSNATCNLVRYSLETKKDGDYFTQRFSVEPTYTSKNGWMVINDFDYLLNRGQSSGFNQSVPLWNAGIARLFGKKKEAELRLTGFDLLNQNKNISRTVEQNYMEDVCTEVLNRYFLLSFTYHLRKFKGGQSPSVKRGEKEVRGG